MNAQTKNVFDSTKAASENGCGFEGLKKRMHLLQKDVASLLCEMDRKSASRIKNVFAFLDCSEIIAMAGCIRSRSFLLSRRRRVTFYELRG